VPSVALSRNGYAVIHSALVPVQLIRGGTIFGAPCEIVAPPIVTRCGVTLRSVAVVMKSPVDCRTCKAVLAADERVTGESSGD
jgi:hypothetical protein